MNDGDLQGSGELPDDCAVPDNGELPGGGALLDDCAVPDNGELRGALEAVLLVIDSPVSEEALAAAVERTVADVHAELTAMTTRLAEQRSGIDLRHTDEGWRFYTRSDYAPVVERFVMDGTPTRLSTAAMETLAVIAYRQPVTRARIAAVRGVNVDGVVRTLMARGLIAGDGTDADTGGVLYRTTDMFLETMGLTSLEDLPDLGPLLPDVDAMDDE